MKDTELREERNDEVYRTYVRGLKTQTFNNMHEAIDWVRMQPASKFYLSPKSLVNYIHDIDEGSQLDGTHPSTREKVMMLYEMYVQFRKDNPCCRLSKERICELLVEMPAPRFFLGHDYTLMILQKERKRRRKR